MKYFSWAIVCIIFLSSCAIVKVEYDVSSVPSLESLQDIDNWIWNNIKYVADSENYGYTDYWASPEETLVNGSGDCEDNCILFLYLAHVQLGLDGRMVIEVRPNYKSHAYAVIGDYVFYSAGDGGRIEKIYRYEKVMQLVGGKWK